MAKNPGLRVRILIFAALLLVISVVFFTLHPRDRSVQPEDIAKLIDRANKLVVLQEPWNGSAVLFESSVRHDLDALKAALGVERPERHIHCMCDGTPAIILYADGEKIGQITNHHAMLIRCSLWSSDAKLTDVAEFLKWFDDRNILAPRREYEAGLERHKEWQAFDRKWLQGMPTSLKPLWPAVKQSFDPDLAPLRKALAEQFPVERDRILALFSWYGCGAGPWTGFQSYEDIAEKLLLDYTTAELLASINGKELNASQTEGVARLFGSWTFSQMRPKDRKLLPADLKTRLLMHSLATGDDDKRGRAQSAFGEAAPNQP